MPHMRGIIHSWTTQVPLYLKRMAVQLRYKKALYLLCDLHLEQTVLFDVLNYSVYITVGEGEHLSVVSIPFVIF